MATMEELHSRRHLTAFLDGLDEGELAAQQIVQRGAIHALSVLLERGCTEEIARGMLASLQTNMAQIEAIAKRKGFQRLFANGGAI